MDRIDRLYALVEELRAISPRPRSARWLATRFERSVRTIERDISALQAADVPIYAETGRFGGYALDKAMTLPPVNVTASEVMAIAVALRQLHGTPFYDTAHSALRKLVAIMPMPDVSGAQELASRVVSISSRRAPQPPPAPRAIVDALVARRLLRLNYIDRHGTTSWRLAEPVGYVSDQDRWYLFGWCRMRNAFRVFRLDRILAVRTTNEVVKPSTFDPAGLNLPDGEVVRPVVVAG